MSSDATVTIDERTQTAVQAFLRLASVRYEIAGAILFGSRARGDQREDSDADLMILLRGAHQGLLSTKLDMADLAFDVLLDTEINISPLPVWLDQWEHPETFSNPALLYSIAREGIPL
ncbi:nucleotidyltransferase domain-containing protein [Halochromatium roseum]|uniref:nucleotidyltransferase domain-containing protein n=1 Tax=Halochromatium roseum TaxID=391920 RepID=UPI0019137617|nr:nucleotidyltransferase domain-containing protein [Halochromatium roseum]MBK5942169.1 DNA polymerase III subunit beta [Halochromatium roseum]